ncbi:Hypotehtical protein in Cytochrome oxidase biogenesis cluster [Vibrio harveyi]|uniref:cytochrome oxidase biogenesis cluster protein n=1 Tax=Vibrio harveyi TaxID=669 RepID=UPI001EFC9EEC|nr:cytochrome oxidase biogenesis cluster protein [Vibrio harveyi]MCG9236728.1 cytochrome oxidase biogenesis cluster protein [Vibrio harveyi]MCG9589852.1 cytochrome oxidase biogenesis cluster protein [Vibrio harveyi]CAH1223299.1 Hypotehtical protein in Cytochrome oxidase biogenesis cluster [Vibrio harveyi]CAH1548188.1 Hypotehtical protein in Cytochrome oxidase biogenesis cluster [Vibrio harveyi]CAH1552231.1 Hypotehtical protein in Cytochrome oxidase biogenesis cluster [Vibrio harveyi]
MTNAVTKGRIVLVSLICLFALPAIIAKVVLSQGWYETGVTNRGELVEPYITFEQLGQPSPLDEKGWQLAYVLPPECKEQCQQQIHLMQQSHIALGKYQERVVPVIWASEETNNVAQSIVVMQMNDSLSSRVKAGQMLIVDPLGQLVMSYTPEANEDLVRLSKDVLADLRKLLKLSRVG